MSVAAAVHGAISKRRWTPAELGTLSFWLDADDASTITIATGVSQWNDKSSNGYNMTQASTSNQPAYVTNAQNGRAVVRFTPANSHQMAAGDVLDIRTGGMSIVAAYKNNANGYVLTKTAGAINVNSEWGFATSQADFAMGGVVTTTGGTATNATKVSSWVMDRSAGSTFWVNGTETNADTSSPFPNTDDLNNTAALTLGNRSGATTLLFNGDLYEIVVSLSAISTSDRQKLEGYLAWKWGRVSSLPSDHPYKNIQP